MSDLTSIEKRKLERALDMPSGFVLNFSNRTFEEFFIENFRIEIYSERYALNSGSKANRMRAFWNLESNHTVFNALNLLFKEWQEFRGPMSAKEVPAECWSILERLKASAPVIDVSAVTPNSDDVTFDILAKSVRDSIERNEPETGLDRLHTFLIKYFRVLCTDHNISTETEKPLHSLVGEYIKALRKDNLIESDITEKILKSTISVMEAFNHVRNNQSFAHDNKVLNYNESLLIFSNVTSSIRFIEAIEAKRKSLAKAAETSWDDDFPF